MKIVCNMADITIKIATVASVAVTLLVSSPSYAQDDLPPLPPGVTGPIGPPPAPYVWPGIDGQAPRPLRWMTIDGKKYAADQVLVKFKKGVAEDLISSLLTASGLEQKSHIRSIGARLITFPGPLKSLYSNS